MMKAGWKEKGEKEQKLQNFCHFCPFCLFCFHLFHHPPNHRGKCLQTSVDWGAIDMPINIAAYAMWHISFR
jgi:hypothetical protein